MSSVYGGNATVTVSGLYQGASSVCIGYVTFIVEYRIKYSLRRMAGGYVAIELGLHKWIVFGLFQTNVFRFKVDKRYVVRFRRIFFTKRT